ncbi:hypothetical protein BJ742DRAFT_780215 [Cladochytrium replicatum]|nr:hypothetical protein BJ742DRAFT_780215 [Cladochytrium replicatum]
MIDNYPAQSTAIAVRSIDKYQMMMQLVEDEKRIFKQQYIEVPDDPRSAYRLATVFRFSSLKARLSSYLRGSSISGASAREDSKLLDFWIQNVFPHIKDHPQFRGCILWKDVIDAASARGHAEFLRRWKWAIENGKIPKMGLQFEYHEGRKTILRTALSWSHNAMNLRGTWKYSIGGKMNLG